MKKLFTLFILLTLIAGSVSGQINYSTSFDGCNASTCSGWTISGGYSPSITSTAGSGYSPCNTSSAKSNIYSSSTTTTLAAVSSLGTSTGAPATVSFSGKAINYSTGAATPANSATITASWSTASSGPWTSISSLNNVSSTTCTNYTFAPFTPTAGQPVFIRFVAVLINSSQDFWMVFDDIVLTQGGGSSPVLNVSPNSLAFGYSPSGTPTTGQTYTLSGSNLTAGPIVVTAPTGFQVSSNGSTWVTTFNVTYTPPTLPNTTIHVRFNPSGSPAAYSGNVTNVGGGASSNVAVTGTSDVFTLYCASSASSAADEEIYSVTVAGNTNAYACTQVAPGPGSVLNQYSNFYPLGSLANMPRGTGVAFSVSEDECDGATYYAFGLGIWIDFNQDGDFLDANETVYLEQSTLAGPRVISGTLAVPPEALLGVTAMRVTVAEGFSGTTLTPCLAYGYGETEDYKVTITEPAFGTLQGYVYNAEGGCLNPITGATVTNGILTTTTNASGFYQFSNNVPVGTYAFTASQTGFVDEVVTGIVITQGNTTTQDFCLDPYLAPPTELNAAVTGQDVHLEWLPPNGTPAQWLMWDDGTTTNSIGTGAAAIFGVASRWPVSDIAAFDGMFLRKLEFWPAEDASICTYTVKVWEGANAATEVFSYTVPAALLVPDAYNTVTLPAIEIDGTQELWFGFEVNTTGGYPAGCDNGPQIAGKGNMMNQGTGWVELTAINPALTYNWTIHAWVSNFGSGLPLAPLAQGMQPRYSAPGMMNAVSVQNAQTGKISRAVEEGARSTRTARISNSGPDPLAPLLNLTGYNLYRDNVAIQTNTPNLFYDDLGLAAGDYVYEVSAVYNLGESQRTGPVDVSIVLCQAPTLPYADNVTTNGADLYWTDAGGTYWDLYIVPVADPNPTSGSTPTVNDVTVIPYTWSGGAANTDYKFFVRRDCGQDNSDVSVWVGPANFTTLCSAEATPYTQSFPLAVIPDCWSMSGPQPWLFTTGWPAYGAAGLLDHTPGGGTNYTGVDGSGSAGLTGITMVSSFFDIFMLSNPQLRFFMFNNNTSSTLLTDEQSLRIDLWDGAAWNNSIFFWNFGQNAAGWQEQMVPLTGYTITGPIQLRFVVDKGTNFPFYDDIILDDIFIEEQAACPAPGSLVTSVITSVGATMNWNNPGGTYWDLYIVPAADPAPTAGSTPTVNDLNAKPYVWSGGSPQTAYKWYVRQDCGQDNTNVSTWSGPSNFTTTCGTTSTFPFTENFEGTTFPPNCWTRMFGVLAAPSTLTSTTSGWIQDDWRNLTTPVDKAAKMNIWSTGNTYWLMTPQLDLGTGTYQLEFDLTLNAYATADPPGTTGTDDKFAVVISTDGGVTWTSANTLRLWDNAGSPYIYNNINYEGEHVIIPLSGYSGVVMIGFYGESTISNADNDLMVNNVIIQAASSCQVPTNQTVTVITPDGATLGWTDAGGTYWDLYIVPASSPAPTMGSTPTVNDLMVNSYVWSDGDPSTAYKWYVRRDCSQDNMDVSYWVGPSNFTTLESCPAPTALNALNITAHTADITWTAGDAESAWEYYYSFTGAPTPTGPGTPTAVVPVNLTNLDESTIYQFWVRAVCGTEFSSWAGPYSFTTLYSCPPPTAFTVQGITTSSAEFNWTGGGEESSWNVEVGFPGFSPGSGNQVTGITATPTNSWTAFGLNDGEAYQAYVQGICGFDAPKIDFFWLGIDAASQLVEPISGGFPVDEPGETGLWYEYTPPGQTWFNTWFYNDEFDSDRMKIIRMGFYVKPLDNQSSGNIYFVVNWSTPAWPGPGFPTPADEAFIMRSPVNGPTEVLPTDPENPNGQWFELYYVIPDYNPEWVSVDIWGDNITIAYEILEPPQSSPLHSWWLTGPQRGGILVHECLPKPAGDASLWVGPLSFNTLCNPINVLPYAEGFENTTWPPVCWTDAVTTTYGWNRLPPPAWGGPNTGAYYAYCNLANSDLISPVINISENSRLVYYYRAESSSNPQSMDVFVNNNLVHQEVAISNVAYQMIEVPLAAYIGQTIQVKFTGLTGTGGGSYGICLDDVSISTYNNTWTGAVNTAWNNPANWSAGIVPGTSDHVTIPSVPSGGVFPVIPTGVTATCYDVNLQTGATIIVQGTLNVLNP